MLVIMAATSKGGGKGDKRSKSVVFSDAAADAGGGNGEQALRRQRTSKVAAAMENAWVATLPSKVKELPAGHVALGFLAQVGPGIAWVWADGLLRDPPD